MTEQLYIDLLKDGKHEHNFEKYDWLPILTQTMLKSKSYLSYLTRKLHILKSSSEQDLPDKIDCLLKCDFSLVALKNRVENLPKLE